MSQCGVFGLHFQSTFVQKLYPSSIWCPRMVGVLLFTVLDSFVLAASLHSSQGPAKTPLSFLASPHRGLRIELLGVPSWPLSGPRPGRGHARGGTGHKGCGVDGAGPLHGNNKKKKPSALAMKSWDRVQVAQWIPPLLCVIFSWPMDSTPL